MKLWTTTALPSGGVHSSVRYSFVESMGRIYSVDYFGCDYCADCANYSHMCYALQFISYNCLFTFWKEPTPALMNQKQHNNMCQEQHTKTLTPLVNQSTPMSTYVFHRAPLLSVAPPTLTCKNKYQYHVCSRVLTLRNGATTGTFKITLV